MAPADTIFALSSGQPPSGVAVVRISGPGAPEALRALAGTLPVPRRARFGPLRGPEGDILDQALQLFFPCPASATGEDVVELHLHGGRAVVAAVLSALGDRPGLRLAQPGEFTRRAHANGKLDLAEVEGLADLIAAESEAQRRQALALASGALSRQVEGWRDGLVRALALREASLDFADEGDVPQGLDEEILAALAPVRAGLTQALRDAGRGERVRGGLVVALAGPPNAGKSSLLNRLAGREAAIVSPVAGTTRDVLEVHFEIAGQAVTVLDTAGLRETSDLVESEGVRRALARAEAADVVLWLSEDAEPPPPALSTALRLRTKVDQGGPVPAGWQGVSVRDSTGLEAVLAQIEARAGALAGGEPALVSRARQRREVEAAVGHVEQALRLSGEAGELQAEEMRLAARALDRLIGRIDVEDVLDALFGSFCIGK
ncbi:MULTISPECIES: tRNA uridine-5-carboxymethylaminomethyl(34) synthesis GTPase MnmE [unclassified Xanthobacter]|uniref:tRNA uridine-5-carboxymethylaminomethyl(34) synthesis GTPase MnmE n=1 Tax=unclassified Xanthobacter TaxID=2623496 RepID=UPI001EDDD42B|nr:MULTISPECIES: tRNA uridine-5-carboxymethylaminomethyl(34) synthesis GTPase MnmE [unclassified Xanthobacter]